MRDRGIGSNIVGVVGLELGVIKFAFLGLGNINRLRALIVVNFLKKKNNIKILSKIKKPRYLQKLILCKNSPVLEALNR